MTSMTRKGARRTRSKRTHGASTRRRRTRSRAKPKTRTRPDPEFTGGVTRVLGVEPIARGTDWLHLARPPDYDWKPGQFTILELQMPNGKVEDHMFSIACSPTSDDLQVATRQRKSRFKNALHALKPGDRVAVQPADGSFVLDEKRPAAFVTGGIGITATKAMLEYATDKQLQQPLTLIYSNPTQADIAFRDQLEAYARENPRLEVVHTLTKEPEGSDWEGRRGRIDAELVRETVRNMDDAVFYVCGPPSMVRDLRKLLLHEVGIPNRRVKIENFTGYD